MMNRQTKIVCTLGPASESPELLSAMIAAGMNVARLNFSHGTREEHQQRIERLRQAAEQLARPLAILQDLAGPKIRVGKMVAPVQLREGQTFVLTSREILGNDQAVSLTYSELPAQVEPDDTLLLADGAIKLRVERNDESEIYTRVVNGGLLDSHKGINIPQRSLRVAGLTDKDKGDLRFGLHAGVDIVAMSFVRRSQDIKTIKQIMFSEGRAVPVIAKIEKHEALDNIDEILKIADGLMVARGDLAVETSFERVPLEQKRLIEKCNMIGKPVITATQMLKSMVGSPRPTRAEAADVANAVLDGTDAVMLSEETAIGKFPVEAIKVMDRVLSTAETALKVRNWLPTEQHRGRVTIPAAISHAVASLANELPVKAIITPTQTGTTARMVARYRPKMPIIAISPRLSTVRELTLVWGVKPYWVSHKHDNTDALIATSTALAKAEGLVEAGDLAIISAGLPPGVTSTTNLIKVETID